MDSTTPENRDHDPPPRPSNGGIARRQPIIAPLGDLMDDLTRACGGRLPSGPADVSPTFWQDDKNLYISFNLPDKGHIDVDVDVSVCYGKVYIRMTK